MERVCCMCGDVGFSDKLFRCGHCHNRFQHSYCSNYYNGSAEPSDICNWCLSDDRKQLRHGASSSSSKKNSSRSEDQVAKTSAVGAAASVPSPRTATRRYKLLKDVMC